MDEISVENLKKFGIQKLTKLIGCSMNDLRMILSMSYGKMVKMSKEEPEFFIILLRSRIGILGKRIPNVSHEK